MTQRYRKKPVVIEAERWMPDDLRSAGGIAAWLQQHEVRFDIVPVSVSGVPGESLCVRIRTLEGDMFTNPGDWIIKGVHGEFYPCKPDIFEATYDTADEPVDRPNERPASTAEYQ